MKTENTKNGKYMTRTLLLSIFALSAMVAFGGCAEPEPSIIINGSVPMEGAKILKTDEIVFCHYDMSKCKPVKFGEETRIHTKLFADVRAAAPRVVLQIKNRLIDSANADQLGEDGNLRLDTNGVQLSAVEVTFTGPLQSLGTVRNPLGTVIQPDGTLHAPIDIVQFQKTGQLRDIVNGLIPNSDGTPVDEWVTTSVDIQVFGKTLSGSEVVSNILTMPLELCNGCSGILPSYVKACPYESISAGPSLNGFANAVCVP